MQCGVDLTTFVGGVGESGGRCSVATVIQPRDARLVRELPAVAASSPSRRRNGRASAHGRRAAQSLAGPY
jgi:hypothetical protein